ncbi:MAG TPA: diphosphomevalonate decarboxylase [Bacteroidia bacterium]
MKTETNIDLTSLPVSFQEGTTAWSSPSNIALVKYWGKYDNQIPANPSISITLSECHTKTEISWKKSNSGQFEIDFYFDGQKNEAFGTKIKKFLEALPNREYIKDLHITAHSSNTFPHSAGIASSASGMSAFVLCFLEMEKQVFGMHENENEFYREASILSRLASGSASRSVYGGLVSWGQASVIPGSSDLYATQYQGTLHADFKNLQDSIIICDRGEKSVSSRAGHGLMKTNPYAQRRFEHAHENMAALLESMSKGDWDKFAALVENEALTLHGMMMMSYPWFILMKPKTIELLDVIKSYREKTGIRMCFTLDAGPNIHLIYPESEKTKVLEFLKNEVEKHLPENSIIFDKEGNGPQKLK